MVSPLACPGWTRTCQGPFRHNLLHSVLFPAIQWKPRILHIFTVKLYLGKRQTCLGPGTADMRIYPTARGWGHNWGMAATIASCTHTESWDSHLSLKCWFVKDLLVENNSLYLQNSTLYQYLKCTSIQLKFVKGRLLSWSFSIRGLGLALEVLSHIRNKSL